MERWPTRPSISATNLNRDPHARNGSSECVETRDTRIEERNVTYDANVIYADMQHTKPTDAGTWSDESANGAADDKRRHLSAKTSSMRSADADHRREIIL